MRWRIELVLAGIFAALTVLTAVWPTWIETISGASPDGGNGEGERWVAVLFGAGALVAAVVARRERRSARKRTATSTSSHRAADA
jgi:hypothetical protein